MSRPARIAEPSSPDLDTLDAAWGELEEASAASEGALDEASQRDLDDVDEGWETVPDPKGGPPQRRRVPPKERARRKREKQRAKAELAAKKQKEKRRGPKRVSAEREDDVATANGNGNESRRNTPSGIRPKAAAPARTTSRWDNKTLAMVVAAALFAIAALAFMMRH